MYGLQVNPNGQIRYSFMSSFSLLRGCMKIVCSWKQGNVGLIFTKGDLKEVREEISKYKVKSQIFIVSLGLQFQLRDFDDICVLFHCLVFPWNLFLCFHKIPDFKYVKIFRMLPAKFQSYMLSPHDVCL